MKHKDKIGKRVFKVVLKYSVIVLVLIGIYYVGTRNTEIVYQREVIEREVILDNLIGKVNELKGELVSEIRQCESGGYVESDGLIIFDPHKTNTKVRPASLGLYQFKVDTVKHYYKVLYQKEVSGLEAIQIALSEEKASELATDIIFKTDKGLINWYNCSKKLGSQAKLDMINRLIK